MAGTRRRLYIGELSSRAVEQDLQDEFGRFGKISQITMKTGFCFLEFEDDRSAEDAQRAMDSAEFMGRRLRVEFSRPKPVYDPSAAGGDRGYDRDRYGGGGDRYGGGGGGGGGYDRDRPSYDRPSYDRPSRAPTSAGGRTDYRVIVTGMHPSTSWQDLKDFARQVGQVLYTAVRPDERGPGLVGVVEYSTAEEMREALRSLDGARIRGDRVRIDPEGPHNPFNLRTGYRGGGGGERGGGGRSRSRSRDRGAPPPRSDRDYERGRSGRDEERSGRDRGDDRERDGAGRGGSDDRGDVPIEASASDPHPAEAVTSAPELPE